MVLVKAPKNKMNLFELRLKLCQPKPKLAISIKRDSDQKYLLCEENQTDLQTYVIRLTQQDDIPGSLEYLKTAMGRRVGFVYLSLACEPDPIAKIELIREGMTIDHLRIKISVLSAAVA